MRSFRNNVAALSIGLASLGCGEQKPAALKAPAPSATPHMTLTTGESDRYGYHDVTIEGLTARGAEQTALIRAVVDSVQAYRNSFDCQYPQTRVRFTEELSDAQRPGLPPGARLRIMATTVAGDSVTVVLDEPESVANAVAHEMAHYCVTPRTLETPFTLPDGMMIDQFDGFSLMNTKAKKGFMKIDEGFAELFARRCKSKYTFGDTAYFAVGTLARLLAEKNNLPVEKLEDLHSKSDVWQLVALLKHTATPSQKDLQDVMMSFQRAIDIGSRTHDPRKIAEEVARIADSF